MLDQWRRAHSDWLVRKQFEVVDAFAVSMHEANGEHGDTSTSHLSDCGSQVMAR